MPLPLLQELLLRCLKRRTYLQRATCVHDIDSVCALYQKPLHCKLCWIAVVGKVGKAGEDLKDTSAPS